MKIPDRSCRTFFCLIFLLHILFSCISEGRRYDKCFTRDGRQGVCVLKRFCRGASAHTLESCEDDDNHCCPIPESPRTSPEPPPKRDAPEDTDKQRRTQINASNGYADPPRAYDTRPSVTPIRDPYNNRPASSYDDPEEKSPRPIRPLSIYDDPVDENPRPNRPRSSYDDSVEKNSRPVRPYDDPMDQNSRPRGPSRNEPRKERPMDGPVLSQPREKPRRPSDVVYANRPSSVYDDPPPERVIRPNRKYSGTVTNQRDELNPNRNSSLRRPEGKKFRDYEPKPTPRYQSEQIPARQSDSTGRHNKIPAKDPEPSIIRFPETYEASVPRPKVPACGVKPYDLFIAGGEESGEHEWPWMTAIFRRHQGSRPKTFLCGGSLINTRYVLTAAHCFVNNYVILPASSFVVRLGSHYLDNGEEYTVANLVIHNNHSGSEFFNDIALVRLASEVYITDKIAPICLPTLDMAMNNLVGRMATVAGWGDTAFRTGGSRTLQHVVVPIVSSEECFAAYSRVRGAAFLARGSDHVICAGLREGGKDACLGDSGGPLMLKTDDDAWVVVGIVSLGYKCAEPGYPGVYTRVTHYMSWIYTNMKRY